MKSGVQISIEDSTDWIRVFIETYVSRYGIVSSREIDVVIYIESNKRVGYCDRCGSLCRLSKEEIDGVFNEYDINRILKESEPK